MWEQLGHYSGDERPKKERSLSETDDLLLLVDVLRYIKKMVKMLVKLNAQGFRGVQ